MQLADGQGWCVSPTSHEECRALDALGASKGYELTGADVRRAYLNAELPGGAVWAVVCPAVRAALLSIGIDIPAGDGHVVKLEKAVYGLKIAGFAFEAWRSSQLSTMGWELLPNTTSLYVKTEGEHRLQMSVYVDDLRLSCPHGMTKGIWDSIDKLMPLQSDANGRLHTSAEDKDGLTALGVTTKLTYTTKDGKTKATLVYDNTSYAKYWLTQFNGTRSAPLRPLGLPAVREETEADEQPGKYAPTAAKWVGALMWLDRTT